ncbi:ATPase AAA [Actinomycetota bacterium]|nr:ATPase AAA [Actinomycetota bacterium]
MSYRPRIIDGVLARRLGSSGAVLLEGPKACGKTFTAMQHTSSQVYLDTNPAALAALAVDPGLVLNGTPPQLVDEWQLAATQVWNHVRAEVDRRATPGQFVLTGSAVPDDDARRHTGAGRFARLTMRPMSLVESGLSTGEMSLAALLAGGRPTSPDPGLRVPDIADAVVRGGWPLNLSLSLDDAAQSNIDYLRTIAEVDIARLDTARRDPARALRFLQALARHVAMELKVSRIVTEADGADGPIARTTAYDYLNALRRLMVLDELTPWATHLRSRAVLRTASRVHLADPSLGAAALGASPARLLADLNTLGLLFESLVVRDARVYAEPLGATVHHYRDSDDLEVDVIVQTRSGPWGAFEVKLGTAQVDEAAHRLLRFAEKVDTDKVGTPAVLAVVTASGYGYTRPDGVVVVPIGTLGP